MQPPGRILIFQTAFTGDVILTLPLVQVLHAQLPTLLIDVLAIPGPAAAIAHHPAISNIIPFDKKGKEKRIGATFALARKLKRANYDAAIIPHRSLRSAAICYFAGIPRRIGFSTSAGRWLLTDVVHYEKDTHEVLRNVSLLCPLGIDVKQPELPNLYPSNDDTRVVDELLSSQTSVRRANMIAVAPGSVWATKRWLPDRYLDLCKTLTGEGFSIALIGGKEDITVAREIESNLKNGRVVNAVGNLTVLQSAELIRRCKVAVSNDSSPMHLAVAMRTPVVAIFGATVPEFGFAPIGKHDEVVQTLGLECRPCAIHGGNSCPIKTFVCMKNIEVKDVVAKVHSILSKVGVEAA